MPHTPRCGESGNVFFETFMWRETEPSGYLWNTQRQRVSGRLEREMDGRRTGARFGMSVVAGLGVFACAQGPAWERTNPGGGGWFERVCAGPGSTVVACSDLSGIALSTDEGASWQVRGAAHGLESTHVACCAFIDAQTLLLGTDEGIYRSVDGGASWTRTLVGGYIEHIDTAPSDGNIVYAGWHPDWNIADASIARSDDGGLSWTILAGTLPPGRRIIEILVARDDPDRLFVLTGNGRFAGGPRQVLASSDGGQTWADIGAALSGPPVDIALDPFDPQGLYVSVDDPDPDLHGHVFYSADGGQSWTHLGQRGGFLWIAHDDPDHLRMFDPRWQFPWDDRNGVWESFDRGTTWTRTSSVDTWESGWSTVYYVFLSEVHSVAVDEDDPDTLYWVNTQFAWKMRDDPVLGIVVEQVYTDEVGGAGSNRWQSRGIDNVVVMDLAVCEQDPQILFAGFFDLGTFRSLDGGASWTPVNDPDATGAWEGAGGNTWSLLADPDLPGMVWAPQSEDAYGPGTLLLSADAGDTWVVGGAGLPHDALLGLSMDPQSPPGQRVIFLCSQGDVWRSTDNGQSFARVLSHGGLWTTCVDPIDSRYVYAGGEGGLWRSDAFGTPGSWQEVGIAQMRGADPGPPFWGWQGVFEILCDPGVPGRVWVCAHGTGRGLYRSDDRGGTWTRVLADDFVRSVAVDPLDPDRVWATSSSAFDSGGYEPGSHGVWRSEDAGQTWTPMNDGLAWPLGGAIVVDPQRPGALYLASPGAGIHHWAGDACAADMTGDGSVDADDFFAYLDLFAQGDTAADMTGDGSVDADDFFAYLDLFVQGCP